VRIEKISDTQMKFVLMTQDLEERDINISELSYASNKTQELFRELMYLVQDEEEFSAANIPLMFEAMRVGVDSLVVLVTKIADGIDEEQQFNLIPSARNESRFKRNGLIEPPPYEKGIHESSFSIFSFGGLDIMASAVARLCNHYCGDSQVYKLYGEYFLLMQNETEDDLTTGEFEAILFEYGQKHISNAISRQYLIEHGEVIISKSAVEKLRMYYVD